MGLATLKNHIGQLRESWWVKGCEVAWRHKFRKLAVAKAVHEVTNRSIRTLVLLGYTSSTYPHFLTDHRASEPEACGANNKCDTNKVSKN